MEHPSVLMVYESSRSMEFLKAALGQLSLHPGRAHNCTEASHLIGETEPHIVFTQIQLPDGTWSDVVRLAGKSATPPNIIVVSDSVDMKLYVRAIEQGAFDFVSPPFESAELGHVVRTALLEATGRRNERAVMATA